MHKVRALPILSIHAPAVTARLVRQLLPYAGAVILDLEDSCWDPIRPGRSVALREQARADLLALSRQFGQFFENGQIGLRINRAESPEFHRDLDLLAQIPQRHNLACIVPTKVESPDTLDDLLRELSLRGISCREVIPIVETVRGVGNLREISVGAARLGIPALIYGHYDYSLDAGQWPFLEFDDPAFWELVEPIIRTIESAGLAYAHAPFFKIYETDNFEALLCRLAEVCSLPFGVLSLGARQAAACSRFEPQVPPPLVLPRLTTAEERAALALWVCETFEKYEAADKGFAMDARGGQFISPHLYVAARAFLEKQP